MQRPLLALVAALTLGACASEETAARTTGLAGAAGSGAGAAGAAAGGAAGETADGSVDGGAGFEAGDAAIEAGDGATAPDGNGVPERIVSGCVSFERRALAEEGLTPISVEAAAGLQVTVREGAVVRGVTVTGADGCFGLLVAGETTEAAIVEVAAMASFPDSDRVLLALGHQDDPQGKTHVSGAYWRWFSEGDTACDLGPSKLVAMADGALAMAPLVIPERCGSGAIAAFLVIRRALSRMDPGFSRAPGEIPSLAVFWSPDTKSDCGACFLGRKQGAASIQGDSFESLIQLSGRDDYPSHWSPSALAHEAGHWVMEAYSRSPAEAGQHFLKAPSHPGLAYKEGWATAFGQRSLSTTPGEGPVVHVDPVYRDMQYGTTFWVDVSALTTGTGPIELPQLDQGLDQPLNEFVVSSALWRIWLPQAAGEGVHLGLGDQGVLAVLGSARLLGGTDRGYPGLDLLDFLDATVCATQASSGAIGAVMAPLSFPWDSAPTCE